MAAANRYDLRSGTADQRRERDKQHKWCRNFCNHQRPTPDVRVQGHGNSQREVRPWPREAAFKRVMYNLVEPPDWKAPSKKSRKRGLKRVPTIDSDTGAEPLDSDDRSDSMDTASPEVDAEVASDMLPDADPGTGHYMLEAALSKAEHKFEDKQTTKLVKDEYDVVDDGADDGPSSAAVDDDFEML